MSKSGRYLVTGAAGFIGSNFVESCLARNFSVVSVDHPRFFKERKFLATSEFGEIVDLEALPEWLRSDAAKDLKAIVHLGAITDTRESDLARLKKFNLEYSQMLWLHASAAGIPLVYASSAATYGGGEAGYEDDEAQMDRLRPLNAYGASKLEFDRWVLQNEACQRPSQWAGFKFFNVYGYGERHKEFMASVVLHAFDQIREKGEVTLFQSHRPGIDDGHQKRDFVWVGDVVEVLHFALENPIRRGIFNLGTGQARTFLDLAKAVFAAMGQQEKIRFVPTPESIRDKYQYFTEGPLHKLRAAGYRKDFASLEEGVRKTVSRLIENQAKTPKNS